jgi:Na+/H+ antiporter NhaD/arsenite permease-like protein
MTLLRTSLAFVLLWLCGAEPALAQEQVREPMVLTNSWVGFTALALFILAYVLVIAEEFTHMRKSMPVMLAAGIMWALVAAIYAQQGIDHLVEEAVLEFLLEFAELFLFLLAAMTYVNSMSERCVFEALRSGW